MHKNSPETLSRENVVLGVKSKMADVLDRDVAAAGLYVLLAIYEMATIRDAFRHFEDNTCVRFKEVPTNQDVNTNHILVTGQGTGCVH